MSETQSALRAAELFGLSGQTAVVTGANRGIGRGVALELARVGANVVVAARNTAGGLAVVAEIEAAGGTARHLPFELKDEASVTQLMQGARDAFGRLDILVNNAGVYPPTKFLETTADQFDEMHRVNVRGLFFCLREAVKVMQQDGPGGRIVNISSMGSVLPAAPGRFAYNASKASVNRLTQDAAAAFARDGIRVNAILPGPIETAPVDVTNNEQLAKIRAAIVRKIALKRWGTPGDVAAAVIFLTSPASAFITGQTLLVDGGFTLG